MEQLGIANGFGFGMRDCNSPVLWFGIETLGGGSLQIFNLAEAGRLIEEAKVYDIKNLEGRACVVEIEQGQMKFVRWHK